MIVIAASSDLVISADVVEKVAELFATYPGEPIGIRANIIDQPASPLEEALVAICTTTGRSCIRFKPTKGGRAATFRRDYELVTDVRAVYAFLSPGGETMDGGTAHVVKAALDRERDVVAYSVGLDGRLELLGSDEGAPDRPPPSLMAESNAFFEEGP